MQLVLLLVLALLFFFFFQRFLFGVRNLPPGPTIWQLWRRRSVFATKPHVALHQLAKIYGPLISLRLGGQLLVVASSPAIAKEILKTNNQIFSGRYFPSVYYDVPGTARAALVISRECDETWKFLRSIGQNFVFSSKAVELASGIRKTKAMEMVKFLRTTAGGKIVNLERVLFVTFTNIISNVLISRDLFDSTGGEGERDDEVMGFLGELIEKVSVPGLTDVFPALKGIDFWTRRKGMQVYRNIKLIWGDTIEQRRSRRDAISPDSQQDFLDVLNGYSFHHDQIRAVLTELLGAATESSFITAVWLMAELIKNQEILDKVREEIAEKAVEGDAVNEANLSECVYLQACIKETFRLHTPGPFGVPRRAIESCEVSNYTIPKESIVVVNSWAIQMDPSIWEDASSFKPQRFLDSNIDFRGAHFELLPFGAGKRMCPGLSVAIKSLQLVVASLLHYFDWSLPDGKHPTQLDTADKFGTSLRMEKTLHLIPTARDKYFAG